jgi:hypothetical protein
VPAVKLVAALIYLACLAVIIAIPAGAFITANRARRALQRRSAGASAQDTVALIAASCTTGWADGEHGNLWLAPDGLARVPLGWAVSVVHTFQSVDPAIWWDAAISRNELAQVLEKSPRALWLAATDIEAAAVHRGLLVDRVRVHMKDGSQRKLLWVRHKVGTRRLEVGLRNWLGNRLALD